MILKGSESIEEEDFFKGRQYNTPRTQKMVLLQLCSESFHCRDTLHYFTDREKFQIVSSVCVCHVENVGAETGPTGAVKNCFLF